METKELTQQTEQGVNDYYDAAYLNSLLATAEAEMPYDDYAEVEAPAKDLEQNITNFKEGEGIYGYQPETWGIAKPKQAAAAQAIQDMTTAYRNVDLPHEEKEKSKTAAISSLQVASDFFKAEYMKLLEKDRRMQAEMDAMRQQLETMQQMMQNFSPEAISQCVLAGMQFLKESETARKDALEQKSPAAASLYQAARQSVQNVYANIQNAPQRMKIAVQNKAYETADKAVQHVASWFDKGIDYLTAKRNAILNRSPLAEKNTNHQTDQHIALKELSTGKMDGIDQLVAKASESGYTAADLSNAMVNIKLHALGILQSDTPIPTKDFDDSLTLEDFMKNPRDVAEKIIVTMANENDVQDVNDIVQSMNLLQDKLNDHVKQQLPVQAAADTRSR